MFRFSWCIALFLPYALGFTACSSPRPIFQDGLCYKGCDPGFSGRGPVCWSDDCGKYHTDTGAYCHKKSYGRGVGKPLPCRSGFEHQALLCYRKCRTGYRGVGPVCWAAGCPPGMRDIGVSCEKQTRGRGAGTVPGQCTSSSFARSPAPQVTTAPTFNLIIANDPQIVWWSDPRGDVQCRGDKSCKETNAKKEALNQVRAMNGVQSLGNWPGSSQTITKPIGVIINGDLTSFFHPHEFDLFEKYYVKGSNAPHKNVLNYPLYLSLGNHDYANNVKDCWWSREPRYGVLGNNGCAQKAVDYMKGMISCGRIETFPSQKIESYDSSSLAYSWNMGGYHFIQLHNYPTYTVSSIGIGSSMNWLRADLDRAKAANKKIIINMHDLSDKFPATDRAQFETLISKYKIVGIFCGHVISSANLGYQGTFRRTNIPVFRGGHAGQENRNKFLLVQFSDSFYRVVSIDSSGGVPRFFSTNNSKYDKRIAV